MESTLRGTPLEILLSRVISCMTRFLIWGTGLAGIGQQGHTEGPHGL